MIIKIGLDIDGTISANPDFYSAVCNACYSAGGSIHIVTSRSHQAETETRRELEDWGIRFSILYFLPSIEIAQKACPYTEANWYQRYLWQKVQYAEMHGLTHFVDDDPQVIALFERYARHTQIIVAGSMKQLEALLNPGSVGNPVKGSYPNAVRLNPLNRNIHSG